MDDVFCEGNETEIANCRFGGWGNDDCEASEAAGTYILLILWHNALVDFDFSLASALISGRRYMCDCRHKWKQKPQ